MLVGQLRNRIIDGEKAARERGNAEKGSIVWAKITAEKFMYEHYRAYGDNYEIPEFPMLKFIKLIRDCYKEGQNSVLAELDSLIDNGG